MAGRVTYVKVGSGLVRSGRRGGMWFVIVWYVQVRLGSFRSGDAGTVCFGSAR